MPNLTGSISFNVEFNFTGVPAMVLTASATIPNTDKPNLTGFFSITQPDGITTTGLTAIAWDGTTYPSYSVPLRVASDQLYQKGTYTIVFYASCIGYVDGTFTRSWDMEYLPVTQSLTDGFDLFTPQLKYSDLINYGVGGYSITGVSSLWAVTSPAGNISGTSSVLYFLISGNYYDSTYVIKYTKTVNYLHGTYAWLTVKEKLSITVTKKAMIPLTMAAMLGYLISIKDAKDAGSCSNDLDELFEDADVLYHYIRTRVCAQNTTGLSKSINEYYELTHNNQPLIYINTNGIIPAYNFAAGCGGGGAGSTPYVAYYTAITDNVTVITTTLPAGARVIGLRKGINPLLPANFDITALPVITLIGVALAIDETLFIDYAV